MKRHQISISVQTTRVGFTEKVTFEQRFEGNEGRINMEIMGEEYSGLRGWSIILLRWRVYTHHCVQINVCGQLESHREPIGLNLKAIVQMRTFTQRLGEPLKNLRSDLSDEHL